MPRGACFEERRIQDLTGPMLQWLLSLLTKPARAAKAVLERRHPGLLDLFTKKILANLPAPPPLPAMPGPPTVSRAALPPDLAITRPAIRAVGHGFLVRTSALPMRTFEAPSVACLAPYHGVTD